MQYCFIIQTIYFFLPAGFANMAPVLFQNRFSWFARPIDGGATIRGRRVFGEHKTIRGLVCGLFLGTGIAYLQSFHPFPSMEIVTYDSWFLLGFLQSTGALLGDLIKSFFKRQLGIPPGKPWVPFDQLDFIMGAILLSSLFFSIPVKYIISAFIMAPFFHITINRVGYYLKIRQTPW